MVVIAGPLDRPLCELEGLWVDGRPVHAHSYWIRVLRGLATGPGRRGRNIRVSGRPGERYRQKVHAPRDIVIALGVDRQDGSGRVERDVPAAMVRDNIDRLHRIFDVWDREIQLVSRVQRADGLVDTRTALAELRSGLEPATVSSGLMGVMAVELRLADPYWYGPSRSKTIDGTAAVFNPGSVRHHKVVLRIDGPQTDPITVTNDTLDVELTIARALDAEEWIEVDAGEFTAVDQDGESVAADVSKTGRFLFELGPGRNVITADDLTVTWRPAYL